MSTSEEQLRCGGLERKQVKQYGGGMDMYGGNMMGILGKGY